MEIDKNEKGQFAEGRKKTGGKQKGYTSPVNKEFRELMAGFSKENYEKFVFSMMQCEPKDFCRFYLELLKFNLPMLQSVSLETTKEFSTTLTDRIRAIASGKNI